METIKNILVATDFSLNGAKAINYAASLASQFKSRLIILHVEDDRQKQYISSDKYESYSEYVKSNFNKISSEYLNYKKVDHNLLHKKGIISSQIVETAQGENADLVLVGISGLNKGFELEFGSVTLKILNQLTCPIIVVPESYTSLSLNNIMIATDQLMPEKEEDTSMINELIRKFDSNVYMVSVGQSGAVYSENYRKLIDKTIVFADKEPINSHRDEIIEHLNAEAKAHHADLVVVYRRKNSLTGNQFTPRLSNLIAINMEIPILFIPCEDSVITD